MGSLASWLKNILGFLILSSVLYELLPEGHNRKYVRLFCGMILMILVFQPVFRLSSFETYLKDSWNKSAHIEEEAKVMEELEQAEEQQKEKVLSSYREWIKGQAEAVCTEAGFSLSACMAELSDEGEILSLTCTVSYRREDGIFIEPVKTGSDQKEKISTVETEKLKQELCKRTELSEGKVEVWLEK